MALKDCIRKMGGLVSKTDRSALEQYIADGLSDEQAVRKLYLESNYNVVEITKRAAEAGAAITERPSFIADIRDIQEKRAEKIRAERVERETEMRDLNAEYSDNSTVIETVREQHDRLNVSADERTALDITDDQELNTVLSSMLFDPNRREAMQRGVLGLQGKTPLELVESFKAIRDRQPEIRNRIRELLVEDAAAITQLEEISGPEIKTMFQDRKGSITFDEMRRGMIRLTETHDLSTFLHEAGHLYLETFRSIAEDIGAPQDIKDDWKVILDYLGVTEGRQIEREHHEQWARSFEKYLMEGKAPSVYLQDAFNSFKRWLELVYSKLKGLAGVELSDDIRGVFDRILASEAQIAEAEGVQQYAAIFSSAEEMGVSQEVFEVYRESAQRAHQEAVEKETKRMLAAMDREQQRWWNLEKDKVRDEVTNEAHRAQVYVALAMLQKGTLPDGSPTRMAPFKMDRDDLIARYGKDFIKSLPKPWIYSVKGGIDTDVAAQAFGYGSGDQMIQELIRTPPMKAWIAGETEARMLERFPDPMLDSTLADDAVRAVHSDRRAAILAAEMRVLRKRAREDAKIVRATKQTMARSDREAREANRGSLPKKLEVAQIKAGANLAIGKKKLRDVQPHVYLNAERKAGRQAFEAAARKDYQKAYVYKRQQIVNHEMYRAAVRAKKQGEATQTYLAKFERKRVQQRLGKAGVLDRILAVIEGVNFRKISLKQVDREKAFDEMLSAVEDGRLIVSPSTLAKLTARGTNWQDLTVDEFAAMRDMVKQLEHLAKKQTEMMVNDEMVDFDSVVDETAQQITENNKVVDFSTGHKTRGKRLVKDKDQAIVNWLRPGSLARILDKAGFGALTRYLIVPIRRAQSEKLIPMLHKQQKEVSEIYLKHYSYKELGRLHKDKYEIKSLGETKTKADIIALALNQGNDGSKQAVLGGIFDNGKPAFNEQGIREMLSRMTEKDWLFVQDIWNYLDTYSKPLMEAEKRRRGISPDMVDAVPFTVRTVDGKTMTLKGGYYPLAYDLELSDRVHQETIEEIMSNLGTGVYVSAQTRAGATHRRTQNHGLVVRLDLNVIDSHLREVIRDIAIGDEIAFVKRIINDKRFRTAMKSTGNAEALKGLNLWLTDSAVGDMPAKHIYTKGARWIRGGFTKSRLAWNALVVALQFTGVFQSWAFLGSKALGAGLGRFMQNPAKMWTFVLQESKFMDTRYNLGTWDKDVQDARAHLDAWLGAAPSRGKVFMNAMAYTYFLPIAKAQQVVDTITWLGGYWKGRNIEGLSHGDSIYFADAVVEGAQTSGLFSDRSNIERGTLSEDTRQAEYIRIWTTLISYMLAKGGIAYEKTKTTNFKNPVQLAAWASDMVLLFMVEGIASAALYGQWPDDEDEPVDWAIWTAEKTAESVMSGIPFVREINNSKFAGGNTPIGSFAHDLFAMIEQGSQLEADDAMRRTTVKTLGTAFHLPSSQTNRVLDAVFSEDDAEWSEYFVGKRGKE